MKYFFILSVCLVTTLFTSEPPQTHQDLLNHCAAHANYGEILRICSYFIEDPKPEIIYHALKLLTSQHPLTPVPLIRAAWNEKREGLLEKVRLSCHTSHAPQIKLNFIKRKFEEFDSFINQQPAS